MTGVVSPHKGSVMLNKLSCHGGIMLADEWCGGWGKYGVPTSWAGGQTGEGELHYFVFSCCLSLVKSMPCVTEPTEKKLHWHWHVWPIYIINVYNLSWQNSDQVPLSVYHHNSLQSRHMDIMASQITGNPAVCSTVCSGVHHRKFRVTGDRWTVLIKVQ